MRSISSCVRSLIETTSRPSKLIPWLKLFSYTQFSFIYWCLVRERSKTLRVAKIRNGTVVDHITPGYALDVLRILGITGRGNDIVSALMNVASKKYRRKDMVKIENRELKPEEVNKIALVAPHATINIIRKHEVVSKRRVKLPSVIRGTVRCANPSCITNTGEPIEPVFYVGRKTPLRLRCHYCDRIMEREDVLKQF